MHDSCVSQLSRSISLQVFLGYSKRTKADVAIKVIDKARISAKEAGYVVKEVCFGATAISPSPSVRAVFDAFCFYRASIRISFCSNL